MPIDGLTGEILVAFAVCVLAVTVALLTPHALVGARARDTEWFDGLSSPYPCACGELADPKG